MIERVHVARRVLDEVAAHAREESPNECCGLLIGPDTAGGPLAVIDETIRCRNLRLSPSRYQIDPRQHFDANRRLRGSGRAVAGAYHSHPRSVPVPSDTDVAEAWYPEFVWMIVSLAGPPRERIRAYRIAAGNFAPLPVVTVP